MAYDISIVAAKARQAKALGIDQEQAPTPTRREVVMAKRKKAPVGESKNDKFRRLVNGRVPRAVKAIDSVAGLASPFYERTDEQVAKIIAAMQAAVDRVEKAFAGDDGRGDVPII